MKIEFKKVFAATLSLLFIAASFIISSKGYEMRLANANALNNRVIIIDAGHGGFDGGAQAADGTVEKDINLQIATQLIEILVFCGFVVVMTRTDDSGTEDDATDSIKRRKVSDMQNRLELTERHPDATFISIHLNKFTTSSANGAQVFYSKNNPDGMLLANAIQNSIAGKLQPDNDRVVKQGTSSTYLLHRTKIPAVIVECGFLSNAYELKLLKSEEYQRQMAFAIFCGICDYYNKGS